MNLILLSVTDLELIAAQSVKFILLLILIAGGILQLNRALSGRTMKRKIWKISLSILFVLLAVLVCKQIIIDGSLLNSSNYTIGTTLGICQVFARGSGISFEYNIGPNKYLGCSTSHPIPMDSLTIEGGKYFVRFSNKYPDKGRIDFRKPSK